MALVSAAAGCGSDSKPRVGPHLDAGLTDFRDIPLGRRIGIAGGSSAGDVGPILVYADSYPYDRFRRVAATHLDGHGAFKVFLRPDRNTRYRLATPRAPRASSGRVLDVYVEPRVKLTPFLMGPRRARLIAVAQLHRGALPLHPLVYFYFRRGDASRYRLLGSSPTAPIGHDRMRAVWDFSVRPRHGDQVISCTRTGYARDMGRPAARIRHCGRPMLPSPQLGVRANQ